MNRKIVMLCSDCFSTTTLYNFISRHYPIDAVISEDAMRGMALAKRRVKKLGLLAVGSQVLFSVMVVPLLRRGARKRIDSIKKEYGFDEQPIPAAKITRVGSVNEERCIALLKEAKPDVVLVNGTRIISRKVLESVNAVFINMHTGITPKYRGVHGGYWALVKDDREHCGVTVHLVDKGIDTGGILYQAIIDPIPADNFVSYPYLQFGEGIPLVKRVIDDLAQGSLKVVLPVGTESHLYSHPTIWQYLYWRIFRNKK
jgi:methionyl-tRNA formyltransferase